MNLKMADIIKKVKINKVDFAWVQVSEKEAILVRYVSDKEAKNKAEKLKELKAKLKEVRKKLGKEL